MKVRFFVYQFPNKVANNIRFILSLKNIIYDTYFINLELQELTQIPYRRQIFMHKLSRGKQKRDKEMLLLHGRVFKCITIFSVLSIILMYLLPLISSLRIIQSTCPKVDDLYCHRKF